MQIMVDGGYITAEAQQKFLMLLPEIVTLQRFLAMPESQITNIIQRGEAFR